jgi:hypothetical protein
MKRILLIIAVFFLASSTLSAEEAGRITLAKQLAEVFGFEATMEDLKKQTEFSVDRQISQMMDQFKKSFSNVPPQLMKELAAAAEEFSHKVRNSWNAAEAAKVYSTALADVLPENELRASIEHYRTPEGQHQLKAINEAASKLNAYILGSIQQATEAATQEFFSRIRFIAEKARRDREAEQSK